MNKKKIKYRFITYLLSFIYLNFFFLTPFIHHHHSENEISQKNVDTIHSHLFNDINDKNYEESDHFEHKDQHSHLIHKYENYNLSRTRVLRPALIIDSHSTLECTIIIREISSIETLTIDGLSKYQWDKYIHSAANISPPLV